MGSVPLTPAQKRTLRHWLIGGAIALVTAAAVVCYVLGVGWVVISLDWFWELVDVSTERLKIIAALLPLAVAYIAYQVYRADRWWKRAEWALDASLDGDDDRSSIGKQFMALLAHSGMAPKDDLAMWNQLGTEERTDILLDIYSRDEAEDAGDPGLYQPLPVGEVEVHGNVAFGPVEPSADEDELTDLIGEFMMWQRSHGSVPLDTEQVIGLIMDAGRWATAMRMQDQPTDAHPSEMDVDEPDEQTR